MEIKVKKEKEPELKLKKEAQVTVHKKNPILSAKEKKAAFTSKPVADLLGQRKKKEGADTGDDRVRSAGAVWTFSVGWTGRYLRTRCAAQYHADGRASVTEAGIWPDGADRAALHDGKPIQKI